MEAIVLAGGLGTRLKEMVPDLPKPMALVAGKPFMAILLRSLSKRGFTYVVLSLGFMAEKFMDYFGDRYANMKLEYEVEPQPLGTGGAIRKALRKCTTDHVFVFNGDTYLDLEVDEVEKLWHANQNPIIVLREVSDTARYGNVEIKDGRIIAFREKGQTGCGLINAGCYVLPREALDDFPKEKFSLENDYLASVLNKVKFDAFVTRGYFIDIGVPEDFMRAQKELSQVFR